MTTFWQNRRVLVTGATGLLGSHLTHALLNGGADVTALVQDVHPSSVFALDSLAGHVTVVPGNLEDIEAVERAIAMQDVDTVFHVGAQALVEQGVRAPWLTFEANIRGTYNVLDICRRYPRVGRVVCASSDKAYGSSPQLPYTEDMPLKGEHPYDVSKSCMDLLCQTYAHTYNLPVAVLRCGNIYGPGDTNWSRLIPGTIRSVLEGRKIDIRSDGTNTRDYLFVSDIVDGYLLAAERMDRSDVRGQAFNLGPNDPLTVLAVVQEVLAQMNATDLGYTVHNTAHLEIKHQYLSSEKARAALAWQPHHTLSQGLQKTIPWYRTLLQKA